MVDRDEARSDDAGERTARGAVFTSRGVSFALLAHPMVQGIRFLSKVALPWFLDPAEFGEAALASAILFGVQHVAVFGLDEALVSAKTIDGTLFARMRRFQTLIGVMLAVLVACAGLVMRNFPSQAELGTLLIAFSPMTIVANRATLPTALLVRERCYARVFAVDLTAITTFTVVAVLSAALGAGAWSLVLAWHANAIAAMISSTIFARPLMPAHTDGGEPLESVERRGAHFAGAAVLGYLGERADSMSIGFVLGRSILALYEQGQNLAQVMVNYAASLSERLLFPTLAMHHREGGLGRAYLQALRITLLFVLPLHVLLASLARPLVSLALPEEWHGAAELLPLLALVAAARCFDITSVTALKAAGHGRTVFHLGILRIALLVVALALSLRHDARTVAAAVLASRTVAAGVSLLLATRRLDLAAARPRAAIGAAGTAFLLWALAFVPGAWYLVKVLEVASVPLLAVAPLLALILWLLARAVADRAALSGEIAIVRARLERPTEGGSA
jgi:O-antigen/teichoic acid export membrane protein